MEMVLLEASQIRTRQTNEVNVMRIDWWRKGDQDCPSPWLLKLRATEFTAQAILPTMEVSLHELG